MLYPKALLFFLDISTNIFYKDNFIITNKSKKVREVHPLHNFFLGCVSKTRRIMI